MEDMSKEQMREEEERRAEAEFKVGGRELLNEMWYELPGTNR